jgi:plastocyanin
MKLKSICMLAARMVILLASFSCSKTKDNSQPPSDGNSTFNIHNMAFPAKITVKKGTTVKWFNQDGVAHTVTSDDGTTFDSGNLAAGATFSYTATTVGTFPYHCELHSNMTGILEVTQ